MTIGEALRGIAIDTQAFVHKDGASLPARAKSAWRSLSIMSRFTIAATAVIGLGMIVLVWWVSARIERGVVEHAGASSAINSDSLVEPHLQSLSQSPELLQNAKDALDGIIANEHQAGGIMGITIWMPDGRLVYFSDRDPNRSVAAFPGAPEKGVYASYDEEATTPRLRTILPMHDGSSGRTIAFASIDRDASILTKQLARTTAETALVTGVLSMAMIAILFGIVRQASETIAQQREALAERVTTLSELLEKNSQLQNRLMSVTRRSSETNDRALRRIGAELHDGPVQLIALSLLRLEGLKRVTLSSPNQHEPDVDAIESALRDALAEMRGISAGLALPRLEGSTAARAIEYAVMNHEKRSRTRVRLELAEDLPQTEDMSALACLYRFTQECLTNAARHAKGKGQRVRAVRDGDFVLVEVSDEGPGFDPGVPPVINGGLGLIGLADRVQTLGGVFEAGNGPTGGAIVTARLPLAGRDALPDTWIG